jgi:hypothetical protein
MSRKVTALLVVICLVSVSFGGAIFAAPADMTPFEVTQPSGEEFIAHYWGDEFCGGTAFESGEVIKLGDDKYWYYVEIIGAEEITRAKCEIDPKPEFAIQYQKYNGFYHNQPSMTLSLPGQVGDSIIDQTNKKVICVVPLGYDLTSVKPQIWLNTVRHYSIGNIVDYDYNQPQDFSKPVEYTLSFQKYGSEPEIIEKWTVECVTWGADYKMFEVNLPGQVGSSVVDMKNNIIKLYFKPETDLTGIEPSIKAVGNYQDIKFSMIAIDGQNKFVVFGKDSEGAVVYSDIFTLECDIIENVDNETGIIKGAVSYPGLIKLYDESTGNQVKIPNTSPHSNGYSVEADFDFVLTGIPEGKYKVAYCPPAGSYVREKWYKDAYIKKDADAIIVKSGEICDDIFINTDIIPATYSDKDSYEFTSKGVGEESEPQRITISAGRTYQVTIESVSLSGADKADFTIVNDEATGKTGLINNGEIFIDVVFKPLSEGEKNAEIIVRTGNDIGGVTRIPLSGNIIGAVINPPEYRKILKGDADLNGQVNSTDYAVIKRVILGNANPIYPAPLSFGMTMDVNDDGAINSTDYSYMKKYLLGIVNEFPADDIEYILGDLNHDKKHTYADIEVLKMKILGIKEFPSYTTFLAADMNEDGCINIEDVLQLERLIPELLTIEKVQWYTSMDGSFGNVVLHIAGKTTFDAVTVRTMGDGVIYDKPLKLDKDNNFDETVVISFTHQPNDEPFHVTTTVKAAFGNNTIEKELNSGELVYNMEKPE